MAELVMRGAAVVTLDAEVMSQLAIVGFEL